MSPRQYVRAVRLNRARRMLRRSSYPETLVQDIATQCDYWDFGGFASKYQRLFGEYPIQTAKKAKKRR